MADEPSGSYCVGRGDTFPYRTLLLQASPDTEAAGVLVGDGTGSCPQ